MRFLPFPFGNRKFEKYQCDVPASRVVRRIAISWRFVLVYLASPIALSIGWLVVVTGTASAQDFDTEIIPILTKSGCNAGACHGAAAGRGEFHLSLFGSDAAADYQAIAQAYEGRRINRKDPHDSLVIAKPTGQLEHGGETVLLPDGPGAQAIESWIATGAKRTEQRSLIQFQIVPPHVRLSSIDESVTLNGIATFSNGDQQDVTQWTVFTPVDAQAVTLNVNQSNGVKVQLGRLGRQVVIARFLNQVIAVEISMPLGDTPIDLTNNRTANFIDEETLAVLHDLHVPASPRADRHGLLRRVYLDLIGRLPTIQEAAAFQSDSSDQAYEAVVDQLLSSQAYADFWTLKFSRWLRVHSLPNDAVVTRTYTDWINESIRNDIGIDEFVRQLLVATGDSHDIGPANFSRMTVDARDQATLVSQFMLGARMACANCHNHPLDRWTQDDFHGLAAVFAKIDRSRIVRLNERGAITNPRTGEPAIPRIPAEMNLPDAVDSRIEFANWLLDPDNRYLPRVMVNRLWQSLMGRGLVEPVDDIRDTNPATHPRLLQRLADDFVVHGYRLRHSLKLIALSETYQRSSTPLCGNELDTQFYSHALSRPLEPEVLADAIADVTGVANQFEGQSSGTRAITLYDPLVSVRALEALGRCSLITGCTEPTSSGSDVSGELYLINSDFINAKISSPDSYLHGLIQSGNSDREIVAESFLRALGLPADAKQLSVWNDAVPSGNDVDRVAKLEDFLWSLLNSLSFKHNH